MTIAITNHNITGRDAMHHDLIDSNLSPDEGYSDRGVPFLIIAGAVMAGFALIGLIDVITAVRHFITTH